jgi:DNA modification methylase
MGKYNDIEDCSWKENGGDLTTDSLWITNNNNKFIIPRREFLPKNSQTFHGLFISEIPYQFIKRFTKQGEFVWDCFGGSGTTKKVADILKRNCIINDLTPKEEFITQGDSEFFDPKTNVQLIIMHPPYHNIIKYSDNSNDGSNFNSIDDFLKWFTRVSKNVIKYLDSQRFLILVCGNIYSFGEEHTLGVWCKDIIRTMGFKCKSHIIKDYGETKGSSNNHNLDYYRKLKGNFNSFYGDNIFVLQKD